MYSPIPQYFQDGDFITCYFSEELAYEDRVNELLTLFRSEATKEIVGCKIKGASRIVKS